MTPAVAVLGVTMGLGLAAVWGQWPRLRQPTLAQRVAPYLADRSRPSRLLLEQPSSSGFPAIDRLIRPWIRDRARTLDRVLGGGGSLGTRLDRLGRPLSLETFRTEQLSWGVVFAVVALGIGMILSGGVGTAVIPILILGVLGFVAGVVARDRALSRELARRRERMLAEFPTIVELLALAVSAGEGVAAAIERVADRGHGALVGELRRAVTDVRAGTNLIDALQRMADRTDLVEVSRFVDSLAVAVERGTPLGDVMRAQAFDAREASRRALIESGGRKEISMMVPVVFLVLPVSVIFALFPGFYGLSMTSP
jgi:tight adherence protein C